ncbi:caffeoylshikimate esterase isoform X1 [Cryptomeria japonica]|uniref:caffeoylshikimate esterase isoform X1 n=1 Tax=Cryptomeria japonica TaxID=3369 RepID=UPI0027DAB464|nr:caffeoylshikimate esterase isoform X1 [Cryptomeria japonica]
MKMDYSPARKTVRQAFIQTQQNLDHCLFKIANSGVKTEERYEINSRGLEIFSKSWLPEIGPLKAIIFYCHGYGDTCTFFFEGVAKKLAASGYGVFAMDYPGFGLSEGLHCYIPSFDRLVDDVIEQYSKIRAMSEYRDLPHFLLGESLGGAVALKIHLKQPHVWHGAVLVAPMCKLTDDVTPPWLMVQILLLIARIFPKMKWVPQKKDFAEIAFRDIEKRRIYATYNVIAYKDRPRLRTAVQMLRTTQEIEKIMHEVSLPLLILHGADDKVTDPSVSRALYDKSQSADKKLKLYDNAYHTILEGEPDERIFEVLDDIVSWLDEHCNMSQR